MTRLRVCAIPRDPNPYQESLYQAMRDQGAEVTYAAASTSSHTANLVGLPLELVLRRLAGFQVLHIHWTFCFNLPFADRFPLLRRAGRWWFSVVLSTARLAGLRVVWTIHNVMPHAPVFDDDLPARRELVDAADLVISHSASALAELSELGLRPRASVVIPQGVSASESIRQLATPAGRQPRTVLFFGRVEPYKGVEELLEAATDTPVALRLRIAGHCADQGLRTRLNAAAQTLGASAELSLRYVPDSELLSVFESADCCAFPFLRITNSSSVLLAMAAARPVIVPDLPAFADLPDSAVIRYVPGVDGLRDALACAGTMPVGMLAEKGRVAREFALSHTWEDVAERTHEALLALVPGGAGPDGISGGGSSTGRRRRRPSGRRPRRLRRRAEPATRGSAEAADTSGAAPSAEGRAGTPGTRGRPDRGARYGSDASRASGRAARVRDRTGTRAVAGGPPIPSRAQPPLRAQPGSESHGRSTAS